MSIVVPLPECVLQLGLHVLSIGLSGQWPAGHDRVHPWFDPDLGEIQYVAIDRVVGSPGLVVGGRNSPESARFQHLLAWGNGVGAEEDTAPRHEAAGSGAQG